MTTTIHELKCEAEYWDAVFKGDKTFEVRKSDRLFQVGDLLSLRRIRNGETSGFPTGFGSLTHIMCRITYVLPGGSYGIDPDYVVLGLRRL